MLTSDQPEPQFVLQQSSTPPSVLSQGMTETEQQLLCRLLIDLFLERPIQEPIINQKHEKITDAITRQRVMADKSTKKQFTTQENQQ